MKKNIFSKLILFHFFIFNSFITANAQWYDPEKVDKRAGDIYGQALQYAQDEKYTEAITEINKSLAIDPKLVDAYLSRAGIYSALKNYKASIADFETAFQMDTVYTKEFHLP
jgi:Tfp pilus assembly protein PilF